MPKKCKNSLTALFALLLLLSACAADDGQASLADTSWILHKMLGVADLAEVDVTLNFDAEGAIGGNGGCNSYGGSYVAIAAEGSIVFSDIFSTEMFCEGGNASEIEAAYFQALAEAQTYSQTFEFLRINGPSGSLEFGLAP